jgi:hypothetical protein
MNNEAMLALADVIEAADRFDILTFGRTKDGSLLSPEALWGDCGTVACYAGWENARNDHAPLSDVSAAQETLGLTYRQANRLFFGQGNFWEAIGHPTTGKKAARVLRRIVEGKIKL